MSSITSAFVDVLAVAIGADAESLRTGTQITTASVLADLVSFAAVNTARTLVDIFDIDNTIQCLNSSPKKKKLEILKLIKLKTFKNYY